MKIPKKIKIGGHIVNVQEAEMHDDNSVCGDSTYTDNKIRINSKLSQSQKESSFIHEIFHYMNRTIEHDLLDSLSEQFYQVLKDNNLLRE